MKVKFNDPETGAEKILTVTREVFIGEQKWLVGEVKGVRWAVPVGWPNNASPICMEFDSVAYQGVADV